MRVYDVDVELLLYESYEEEEKEFEEGDGGALALNVKRGLREASLAFACLLATYKRTPLSCCRVSSLQRMG
jgi:hypothetical protein